MFQLLTVALFVSTSALAAASPPTADKKGEGDDKMICKTFAETGSLVASKRECKTRRDWDKEREDLRMREGMNANSCRSSGAGIGC